MRAVRKAGGAPKAYAVGVLVQGGHLDLGGHETGEITSHRRQRGSDDLAGSDGFNKRL